MNYFFISVIYNSQLKDSIAIKNLLKYKKNNINIIVVDNRLSKLNIDNEKYAKENDIVYITKHKNLGLSKGTNIALDYLRTLGLKNDDVVTTLDDDTNITEEYLEALCFYTNYYLDVDIFAPFMQGQNGKYYSPAKQGYFKNYGVKSVETIIAQKRFYAIYSCCSSRWRVLKNYSYDENIFVDYIDHNYCFEQRGKGRKFKQIKVVLQQNFSLKAQDITYEQMRSRIRILIHDWYSYCNNRRIRLLGYIPYWTLRATMYALKIHSLQLWFWTMKEAFNTILGNEGWHEKNEF